MLVFPVSTIRSPAAIRDTDEIVAGEGKEKVLRVFIQPVAQVSVANILRAKIRVGPQDLICSHALGDHTHDPPPECVGRECMGLPPSGGR